MTRENVLGFAEKALEVLTIALFTIPVGVGGLAVFGHVMGWF